MRDLVEDLVKLFFFCCRRNRRLIVKPNEGYICVTFKGRGSVHQMIIFSRNITTYVLLVTERFRTRRWGCLAQGHNLKEFNGEIQCRNAEMKELRSKDAWVLFFFLFWTTSTEDPRKHLHISELVM